jgi:predicted RNase H-like nuclease (RuvC/YqgF family)
MKELDSWREIVERLNHENTELKQIVEDLEDKNRKLV